MLLIVYAAFFLLGALAFQGRHWAYGMFMLLGLLFFPARVGFHMDPHPCQCELSVPLALFSLTNYKHIVLFGILFLLTSAQLPGFPTRTRILIALGVVLTMGIYVELAEGLTGQGHCRLRDLVPDVAGGLAGAIVLLAVTALRQQGRYEKRGR
ncbi:MAG: hypothetical protein ABI718_10125 [Acidobacteriota bacterium]